MLLEERGEIAELMRPRPVAVAPEMRRQRGVARLVVRVARERRVEIVERPDLVPAVCPEVLESTGDGCGLHHVVENGLEQVHDVVRLEIRGCGGRQSLGGACDPLDVVLVDHASARVRAVHVPVA